MNPLVSILIPCYNAEPWLAETIESALAQTWQNKEIIIVDDGSTDESLAIAKSFESAYVKVIHQENRGASAARNTALSEAQGEFLQYLDADDLLHPLKVETQVLLLQRISANKLAICGTTYFFDNENPLAGFFDNGGSFYTDSDDPLDWLIRLLGGYGEAAMVPLHSWLVPHSVANIAGTWNEALSLDDDGEYFARVISSSTGIRFAKNVTSYYRKYRSRNSLSRGKTYKHYVSALLSLNLKAQCILQKTNSEKAKIALAKRYAEIGVNAYPLYTDISSKAISMARSLGLQKVDYAGSKNGRRIAQVLGWRVARMLSYIKHRI